MIYKTADEIPYASRSTVNALKEMGVLFMGEDGKIHCNKQGIYPKEKGIAEGESCRCQTTAVTLSLCLIIEHDSGNVKKILGGVRYRREIHPTYD